MSFLETVSNALNRVVNRGGAYLPDGISFYSEDGTHDDVRRGEYLTAYYSNAYRACALAKARPLAALPIHVYERDGGIRVESTKRAARDLSRLLRGSWNPYMTATEGFRWLDMTKDALGEAFVRVEWQGARIKALWPLSSSPEVRIGAGNLPVFEYGGDKFTKAGTYMAYEMVWVKSPVLDSDCLHGVSLAKLAARELGMSMDLEEFYAHVLGGQGNFPGWLETDHKMTEQEFIKLKAQIKGSGGVVNAGTLRIFDNGLKYHAVNQTMVDMSLVEQEKWILQQLCRTLSVPPQEVFDLSNATYSNIEQGALNFANKTLVPECTEIERAFSRILQALGPSYESCYVQFDMNGLLRGSYEERMNGYRVAIEKAIMCPNDVRAKEDMAPYSGGEKFQLQSSYNLIDPETGEVEFVGPSNGGAAPQQEPPSHQQVEQEEPAGEPAEDPIHDDMAARVRARYEERGDTPEFRAFAYKVLKPYANAMLMAHREYDIDRDIEEITYA